MAELQGKGGVGALVVASQAQTQRSRVSRVLLQFWAHPERTLRVGEIVKVIQGQSKGQIHIKVQYYAIVLP